MPIGLSLLIGSSTLVFFSLLLLFTRPILSAFGFSRDETAFAIGFPFLVLMAVRDVLEAIQRVLTGGLRGIGDTRFVLLAQIAASGLVWPPLFLLTVRTESPLLVWVTMPFTFAIHALVLFFRFRSKSWNAIRLIDD